MVSITSLVKVSLRGGLDCDSGLGCRAGSMAVLGVGFGFRTERPLGSLSFGGSVLVGLLEFGCACCSGFSLLVDL